MLKIFTVTEVQLSTMHFLVQEMASFYQNKSVLPTFLSEITHANKTIFMSPSNYLLHWSLLLKKTDAFRRGNIIFLVQIFFSVI